MLISSLVGLSDFYCGKCKLDDKILYHTSRDFEGRLLLHVSCDNCGATNGGVRGEEYDGIFEEARALRYSDLFLNILERA